MYTSNKRSVLPISQVCITTVAEWDSMDRVIAQTCGRAFQTLGRVFSFLLNPQKLG